MTGSVLPDSGFVICMQVHAVPRRRVISRVAMVFTLARELITRLFSTHEPSSRVYGLLATRNPLDPVVKVHGRRT